MKYYCKLNPAGARILVTAGEKASCFKKQKTNKSYLQNINNKHRSFLVRTLRTTAELEQLPARDQRLRESRPRPTSTAALKHCVASQSLPKQGLWPSAAPCRLLPVASLPGPSAKSRARPAPPSPTLQRRPACARARGRAGSPSERPRPACAVRAGGLRLF